MARLTKAQREWRPGMPKKRRSTKVMFASVVLSLEAFVVLFAGLALFGLRGKDTTILIASVVVAVVFIGACAFMGKTRGLALGWVLQLVLIAMGFLEPSMFIIGVLFAVAWWYALRAGSKIDVENARRDREQAEWDAAHPTGTADGTAAAGPSAP
ncbi:DUF4233 domain-containing protein [Arthrobacter sp. 35W]|uniref:DUF4233 domain-containing protein n=1 Tax=Arthrobacter sp. 35W TaxID=1132441 RepID=UPI0004049F82|nr:DUF4233 domain-containing protein [Arthrobacter sp. 35W]